MGVSAMVVWFPHPMATHAHICMDAKHIPPWCAHNDFEYAFVVQPSILHFP